MSSEVDSICSYIHVSIGGRYSAISMGRISVITLAEKELMVYIMSMGDAFYA